MSALFYVLAIALRFKARQQPGRSLEPLCWRWVALPCSGRSNGVQVKGVPLVLCPPRRLLIFFALTFVWSWTCWLLAPVVQPASTSAASTLFFLGGFGPSLAAVVVVGVANGRAGLRAWLSRCLHWRGQAGWITLAFLSPFAVLALAATLHMALGGSVPPSPASGHIGMLMGNLFLVFLVGGPPGEEFGWRGYALPAIQQRLGWRSASLVLGVIWGVWHLPLFFIAGTAQGNGSIPVFFVLIVATSVFYTWLYQRSAGSVLPVLALHTASNSWPSVIPILPSDADQRPYLFVVGLVVTAAIWLLVRRDRLPPTPVAVGECTPALWPRNA